MRKKKTTIWANGATVRLHNKEISIFERQDGKQGVIIQALFADDEPNKPSVSHSVLKNKVRVSTISFSHESMVAILDAYNRYTWSKNKENGN